MLDYVKVEIQATHVSQHDSATVTPQSLTTVSHLSKKHLKQNVEGLKPCWSPPAPTLSKFSTFMIYLG
jgi:hypothetical protein